MLTCLHAVLLLLGATYSAALALQEVARPPPPPPYGNPTLPRAGRVAVVLRGRGHRCREESDKRYRDRLVRRLPCCKAAVPVQREATASLVKYVIQPLEALGNKVDMVVTDGECDLTADNIISQLGDRVLRSEQRTVEGLYEQNEGVRFALEALKGAVPGGAEAIAGRYDLVLLLRQDTKWKLPIDEWQEANFSKFNFPSRCDLGSWAGCISDVFHTMPGHLFPAFDGEVGRGDCFHVSDPARCGRRRPRPLCIWNSGHFCAPQVRARIGAGDVGVITQWQPQIQVREPNEIWELYDVVQ